MGRVRQFLSQDADQVVEPYARFLMSHKLVLYGQGVAAMVLAWVFVSKWVALAMVAIVMALFLVGLASALWRRRHTT